MPLIENNKKTAFTKYIKALSRKDRWGKVLVFLFFLVISAGFWLLQTLQQVTDANFILSITYINQPEQLVIRDSLPGTLTVKALDKGITFLNYSYNKKKPSVQIDLKPLADAGATYTVPAQSIEAECQKALPSTAKLISYFPTNIVIHTLPLKEKTVPVIFRGNVSPAKGFMLIDKVQLSPQEVTVYGSQQALDTLDAVYTQNIQVEDIDQSLSRRVELSPPDNMRLKTSAVDLIVKVEESTEKILEVPIIARDFPKNYRLRTFPPSVQIFCRLPLSLYTAVNESLFEASVFYSDTMDDTTSTVPVNITKKPEWINDNYRFTPERVEYLVEESRSND